MNISDSILQAFDSVRINKLRASLTLLSISIGVFAIIGAGSLVSSINNAITGQMDELGENSFSIFRVPKIQLGHTWHKYHNRKPLVYSEYKEFKRQMTLAELINCRSQTSGLVIKSGDFETDPDVNLIGTDYGYFEINNVNISKGRAFTQEDISLNRNVAIIGNDIVVKVFPSTDPLGKKIKIKNHLYDVIGVMETKGAVLGQSQDNNVIIPITQFLKYYASFWEETLNFEIKATSKETLTETIDEAIGIMRTIRDVKPWEENNFELETNEALSEQFASLTGFLRYFGLFSGFIALIAAGVGIMNIMLVSVKERTREIGVRKAIGARKRWIISQFLIETITLCQIGGFIGIVLGLGASAGLGSLLGIKLVVPFDWIILSILICTMLGIAFGAYPAWKASALDPIEALRYE